MPVFKRKNNYEDHHEEETELWMLPYSTFMLMLVILFIVFYAMSSLNSLEYETALADLAATKPGNPNADQAYKEIALAKQMQKYIKDQGVSDKAQVQMSAQFIKLKLESPALFSSGSAELKADSLPLFEMMSSQLKQMDNMIIVEGHTDNVPMHSAIFNSNWELSAARAFSVIRYYIGKGIDPKRLVAHGLAEFRPVASNDDEIGRAKNRRIEITIMRAGKSL